MTNHPIERREAFGKALASTLAVGTTILGAPQGSNAAAPAATYGKVGTGTPPPLPALPPTPPPTPPQVRDELKKLILADKNKGPTLLRLAWHASGTYSKMTKDGGSQKGTIRFEQELAHGANAGLAKAVAWLQPIKKKYPDVSFADIATLSGVVAIETLGGPEIAWRAGRVDSMDPSDVTPDGRLPAADKGDPKATGAGLRDIFYRMVTEPCEICG